MDIELLLTETKAKFNHNSAKIYLKEKYKSKLTIAEQGGLWVADAQTISLLSSLTGATAILIDTFGNPVMVYRQKLLDTLLLTYERVMQEWHKEYKELESKR